MDEFLPIEELRTLLLSRGHRLQEPDDIPGHLTIDPPEDVYLTVALQPDVVLFRLWRERYYLCKPDSRSILATANVPEDFQRRWESMLKGVMPGQPRAVIAGLATWTVTRLIRCDRVYVWPDKPFGLYEFYRDIACEQVSGALGSTVGSGPLRRHLDADPLVKAAVLDPKDPDFPFLIANYFLFSSQNFVEIYFTADDGSEVFQMHHHDKVVVSIPDATTRSALLAELSSNPALFTDASNNEFREEPEDMTEDEWMEGT
jgi:hypothetical protein